MIYVTHDQTEAMTLADKIVVLRGGYIEQVGAPLDLYDDPDNAFVAGFIGSPTMNLVPGQLSDEGGRMMVTGDGYKLPLPPETAARMASAVNRDVTVGLRPSSFTADNTGGGDIQLKVIVSEYLGAQSVLVTECGNSEILVETQSASPAK